ncbi:hypothetical protein AAFF_G00129930 [Aldrovandia affinis]|uniref:THD domain-containing protein n=1 Tax=Aldrovandia affinis TaxID=143900 RepID=A0AAD7RRC2_9TELE|nr:hypothetical protein AAFF_G00129930 [Aldrovandia affinis]
MHPCNQSEVLRLETSEVQMEPDRSVLILIDHCIEMKRQERNSRIVTVFSFLGFTALFFLYTYRHSSPNCEHAIKVTEYGTGAYQRQTGNRPNAHLTAPQSPKCEVKYLEWEITNGDAYLQDFNYRNNALIVPLKGRYYIYLQIMYRMHENFTCSSGSMIQLSQQVFQLKKSYPIETLLVMASGSINCTQKQWRKSLYTAGVFSFEKDDALMVKSDHPMLIDFHEKKMFFGAFLI